MAIRAWPSTLRESEVAWWISGSARSGGRAISGADQRNRADGGGFWKAELVEIPIYTHDQIRAYRAILAGLDGGAVPIIVPVTDICQPFPGGADPAEAPLPHSDDAFFSDESGYVNAGIEAVMAQSASLRDTTIRVDRLSMSTIKGGEYFSIDHEDVGRRLYIVISVGESSGGATYVDIRPPLRGDVADEAPLDFATPSCTMLCSNAEEAALKLRPPWHGRPTITFIEYIPPGAV